MHTDFSLIMSFCCFSGTGFFLSPVAGGRTRYLQTQICVHATSPARGLILSTMARLDRGYSFGEPTRTRNLTLVQVCGSAFAWPSASFRGFRPLQVLPSPHCVALFAPAFRADLPLVRLNRTRHGCRGEGLIRFWHFRRHPWVSPPLILPHVTVRPRAPTSACPRTSLEHSGNEGW